MALGSFFGGARRGVLLPEGMVVVGGSSFPLLSVVSMSARRRATAALPVIDGAVVGRFLKPNDVATPFVHCWSGFLDGSFSSSGL